MVEHDIRKRVETAAVRFIRKTIDERMPDIDFENRLRIGQRLPARFEHAAQLRIEFAFAGNHARRRCDKTIADVHRLDPLLEYLFDLLEQWLVLIVHYVPRQLTFAFRQIKVLTGYIRECLAFEFGQTVDQPRVDAISQQQYFDTFVGKPFQMRAGRGGRMILGENVVDLVLLLARTLDIAVQGLFLIATSGARRGKSQQLGQLVLFAGSSTMPSFST